MQVRVNVLNRGRKHLVLRWTDPTTGKVCEKSAKTASQRDALRLAGELAAKLREGRYAEASRITWEEFRERFEQERNPSFATRSKDGYSAMFNAVVRLVNPHRLQGLTAPAISRFAGELRKAGLRESSVANHLRHLKAALRWAKQMGLLLEVPAIAMPKRAKGAKHMKGRPISKAEFDGLLAVVPQVVGCNGAELWRRYLLGMWLSGLRLNESLLLYWDRDDRLSVDLTGEHPVLRIRAEFDKGFRDRVLAVAPDFGDFLKATAVSERTGRVFKVPHPSTGREMNDSREVGRIASLIGRTAGVVVDTDALTGKKKYASLHDLRRSFGERWSQLLMPQELMELMRHESIGTTMKFYVGQNAQRTAARAWEAMRRETRLAANDNLVTIAEST